MEPVDPDAALEWIRASPHSGDEWAGFDLAGWESAVWILHAMYETGELPASLSHDEEHRMERAAGLMDPEIESALVGGLLESSTVIGAPLGRSSAPGPGWPRLRWSQLGERLGLNPFAWLPTFRTFPYVSWPVNIRPPAEGSLDREQLVCLCDHLVAATPNGADCFVFVARLASGRVDDSVDELLVYRGEITEVVDLYDRDDMNGPTNMWASDRSWFTYSDWDLWGTKVSGSHSLVSSLVADSQLEAGELSAEEPPPASAQVS